MQRKDEMMRKTDQVDQRELRSANGKSIIALSLTSHRAQPTESGPPAVTARAAHWWY